MKKHKIAISDTDILINLAKIDRLDLLDLLFEEIIIPHYVYDKELSKKAGKLFGKINFKINDDNSIFKVVDRKKDFVINKLAICVNGNLLKNEEAESIYTSINDTLSYPSSLNFKQVYSKSISRFKRKGWSDILGIK